MAWSDPRTWIAAETLTAALMNAQVRDNFDAGIPTGSLQYLIRAATTTETLINGAWLECNGVAVSRTTYADLNTILSALSYPFGAGNGSTTFNLPDLQGRSLVAMASGGHTSVNGLGDSDGLAKASRTPTISGSTDVDGGHEHTVNWSFKGLTTAEGAGVTIVDSPITTVYEGDHLHNFTTAGTPFLVAGVYAVKAI